MTNESNEKLDLLPVAARNDYAAWVQLGDAGGLDRLIAQIFALHEVANYESVHGKKGDELVILEDLDIDSLTLAEILFFAEDLLQIRISNEEVQQMRTVAHLKGFIVDHQRKAAT